MKFKKRLDTSEKLIGPGNKVIEPFDAEFRAKSNGLKWKAATLLDDEITTINRFLPKCLQFMAIFASFVNVYFSQLNEALNFT